MSNFSESHKIINKEIVTNGVGDITGEVMNDVLNTMLDDTKRILIILKAKQQTYNRIRVISYI